MKFDNQLRFAVDIIDAYHGGEPLHVWLKDYFRAHKQMGARDRRLLSALAYSFYRLGHALRNLPVGERLLAGLFLCNGPNDLLAYFRPDWNAQAGSAIAEKIAYFQSTAEGAGFRSAAIFPWKDELSPGIDYDAFCLSFLSQPDLFLRIRPGYEQTVRGKLTGIGEFLPPFTYRLPNGFKLEDHFTADREVVVQDYSSQRIAGFLRPDSLTGRSEARVGAPPHFFWDACAASGGKSILVHDLYTDIDITTSDIRESILKNLKSRFVTAGIKKYRSFVIDLTRQDPPASAANADLILTDVPCTGSGTWGRTPEELYFFDPAKIDRYATVQQQILTHIAPHLAPDATLVYSTCSVFKKENQAMADFLRDRLGLKEQAREDLKGYDKHADTLFAARFAR